MTNLLSASETGRQEPRFLYAPKAEWSHADDCAFLASAYGLAPDPWQHGVLVPWMGVKNGRWVAGRCGLAVPRQNGKNGILEMVELYGMVALGLSFLHTAHEVKTARKAFIRLRGFFTNERQWPELHRLVREIRQTNGQEAIVLTNGASIEFIARSRGSGRGYTVDTLVCDEAQELTDEQLEALLPTISSAPKGNPQQLYTGTPPPPGSPGTVFTRMRKAGVARKSKRLAWVEWSVSEPGNIHDRLRWRDTNPALGYRLQPSVIEDEVEQLTLEGFARERLGWWADEQASSRAFSEKLWASRATAKPLHEYERKCYGVKFSLDGASVALSVAIREGDHAHVELVSERAPSDGLEWLVEWLSSRWRDCAGVAIDGKSGAGVLAQKLLDAKVSKHAIIHPTVAQVVTAHAGFLDALHAKHVTHFNQPELNASVAAAGRRDIGTGGGWGLAPIGQGDVTAAESAILARAATLITTRKNFRAAAPRRLY